MKAARSTRDTAYGLLMGVFVLGSPSGLAGREAAGGSVATPTSHRKPEYVDDATITTGVKKAILSDGAVKSSELQVETIKGVVQLTGFVKTSDQSAAAAKDAASVRGVETVRNNLVVKSPAPPA